MDDSEIKEFAAQRGYQTAIVKRWLAYEADDRIALLRWAQSLKPSGSHFRDFMEWLDEISLRDRCQLKDILGRKKFEDVLTHPRLGRGDKLKRLKDELRRLRYPRLAQLEDDVAHLIKELNLPTEIKVSLPPGFEGGRVMIQLSAADQAEMHRLVDVLNAAADSIEMGRLFDRLTDGEIQ